jgi:hypothetical protein
MTADWTLPPILLTDPTVGAARLASYFSDCLSDGDTPFLLRRHVRTPRRRR